MPSKFVRLCELLLHPITRHRGLVRVRGERPRRRAAEQRDELARLHHEEFPTRLLGEYPACWG
jgi:hypothetical protein